MIASLIVAVVGGTVAGSIWLAGPPPHPDAGAGAVTPAASRTPGAPLAASPHAQRPPENTRDAAKKAEGWTVIESGRLYGRFVDKNAVACGMYDCVGYAVYAPDGCPTSLYIEASIESGGAVVGMANKLLPAIQPYPGAVALLEDYQGVGDSFRITKVNCY